MSSSNIVEKLWNYCNVLRDDGVSYGDCPSVSLRTGSEQLTYLLFLKMTDERTKAPYNQKSPVSEKYGWPSLVKKDGDALFDHYRHNGNGSVISAGQGGIIRKAVDRSKSGNG